MPPIPLFTANRIQQRVSELAVLLDEKFANGKQSHFIGVLKGGFVFLADLIRAMSLPVTVDFIRVSSYGSTTTGSGTPRVLDGPTASVRDLDIVVVEDIIDTGLTIQTVHQKLLAEHPHSLSTVTLLNKPSRRKVNVPIGLTVLISVTI